ncbi:hypothetical protein [Leptospira borgpetersenii]|uniref:hypothetical protein n=1 Tax=Leptospira borgpetersenii TaxID=174 RepID=UPI00215274E7|nr:hypothetical protein [Leptospira borgpetersenii]UVA65729.1 hypothetical protein LH336_15925 [Leptospira borgpetersenii]
MLFSNELNYWVIKKYAKKDLLLRMGRHIRTCPKTSGRNSYESVPTIKSVRKSINHRSAVISSLYYELIK